MVAGEQTDSGSAFTVSEGVPSRSPRRWVLSTLCVPSLCKLWLRRRCGCAELRGRRHSAELPALGVAGAAMLQCRGLGSSQRAPTKRVMKPRAIIPQCSDMGMGVGCLVAVCLLTMGELYCVKLSAEDSWSAFCRRNWARSFRARCCPLGLRE